MAATVLTLHRGGAHPAEIARLVAEAEEVLSELEDALPASDQLREPVGLMADALAVRRSRQDLQATRAERDAIKDEIERAREYPPRGA
jgi:hypothetical protein